MAEGIDQRRSNHSGGNVRPFMRLTSVRVLTYKRSFINHTMESSKKAKAINREEGGSDNGFLN
ncbi:hypothetical protein PanWU01x14_340710 [Parasponia andersonii]|uniref:Uncharacterized protein n=1 Tax=Parasponia andersonii TaxID=3476 RepID=A0A2P5AEB7_PARAD|nr:hypothetical protein PanWU01x14_340710 [Parasponia andersonii]